jgi:Nucleotide-sugar transporter
MSMEYVALANLDAAIFSVLVQTKLLTTASFSAAILRTKFKYIQIISLVLLTVGVMLINGNQMQEGKVDESSNTKGVMATLGKYCCGSARSQARPNKLTVSVCCCYRALSLDRSRLRFLRNRRQFGICFCLY